MKKILIGSYCLIIIGIIFIISNGSFFTNKDSKAIAAGEQIYKQNCISCHGESGKGEGTKVGTAINNQHLLSTVSDKDLINNIKFGRTGTSMPEYGSKLSDKDLQSLTAYIRNWQTKKIKLEAPKEIAGNPENGRKLYDLYCLSCHGEAGAGKVDMGTALANPQYLKYTTDQQIWISTAYGREDTRMGPTLKGLDGVRQLKKDEITDIVTYIRSLQK